MTMATATPVYLCILYFSFSLLTLTPRVSSQRKSNSFDEAVNMCKARDERLVEIKSEAENQFVWRTIVYPTGSQFWLGATNELGTNHFKWLTDGSDLVSQYSNWADSEPSSDATQRYGIVMYFGTGMWYASLVRGTDYVLCERDNVNNLQPKTTEHNEQCNSKIKQLDRELKATASTQRKEYLQLIQEVKQDYSRVNDQLVNLIKVNGKNPNDVPDKLQNIDICKKLEAQANDMATELEFQRQVIGKLNGNVQRLDKEKQLLESKLNSLTEKVTFALKRLPTV